MTNQDKVLLTDNQLSELGQKDGDMKDIIELMTIAIDNLGSVSEAKDRSVYAFQANKLLDNLFFTLQKVEKELDNQGAILMSANEKRELESLGYTFEEEN